MPNIHNVSENTLIIQQDTDTWFINQKEDGIEVSGEFLTIDGYEESFVLKFDTEETKALLQFLKANQFY